MFFSLSSLLFSWDLLPEPHTFHPSSLICISPLITDQDDGEVELIVSRVVADNVLTGVQFSRNSKADQNIYGTAYDKEAKICWQMLTVV